MISHSTLSCNNNVVHILFPQTVASSPRECSLIMFSLFTCPVNHLLPVRHTDPISDKHYWHDNYLIRFHKCVSRNDHNSLYGPTFCLFLHLLSFSPSVCTHTAVFPSPQGRCVRWRKQMTSAQPLTASPSVCVRVIEFHKDNERALLRSRPMCDGWVLFIRQNSRVHERAQIQAPPN